MAPRLAGLRGESSESLFGNIMLNVLPLLHVHVTAYVLDYSEALYW